jgi:gamma-butyrobetaine dioxygenase
MTVVDEFRTLMDTRGFEPYGENVSIAEHCLLTARAAEESGASDSLIAASLMHDVGHWLDEPDDAYGIHSHGELGGDWVAERFGPAISEPVRLHVEAKRYLCSVEPSYHDHLSAASVYTLTKQGGPMSDDEAKAFATQAYADDACTLRRLEDGFGKLTKIETPSLDRYTELLLKLGHTPIA